MNIKFFKCNTVPATNFLTGAVLQARIFFMAVFCLLAFAACTDSGPVVPESAVPESKEEEMTGAKEGAATVFGDTPIANNPITHLQKRDGRLIILGFDGVDPRRVKTMVQAGKLPHIAKLKHRGSLQTTNPPQSPVAWSAFATGKSAGEHGIFDFIARDLRTYFPKVSTNRYHHMALDGEEIIPASAENLRHGVSFWDLLAQAGVAVQSLSVPYAYPPAASGAKNWAGLGTPDVRGINSSFTVLSTDKKRLKGKPPAGGQVAELMYSETEKSSKRVLWVAQMNGPKIKVDGKRVQTMATVTVERLSKKSVGVTLTGETEELRIGKHGGYHSVLFTAEGLPRLTVRATTRFTVRSLKPLEIYVEPFSIIPHDPYLPIAEPAEFGEEIWQKFGPLKTVGWIHDTNAVRGNALGESQFLTEAFETMERRAKMTLSMLQGKDKLLISVFTAPDRIGHMFYRHMDKKHPARPKNKINKYLKILDKSYINMDKIIGRVTAELKEEDTLLVMSDHGFGVFRRGFNVNRWLVDEGYLVLKNNVTKPRPFFLDVDWGKTRAYALGTGGVFFNIKGREKQGILEHVEIAKLSQEMRTKLLILKDGNVSVVRDVFFGDTIFAGTLRDSAPELRIALIDGYRTSWATGLGGIPNSLFEDNTDKWSGDHASAHPKDVPGILFSNKDIVNKNPRIEDLAATAFAHFGIPSPAGNIGSSLFD